MLTKSEELPGGPLSPRAPSSYPSCHAWSLASFTLYGSFNRKCCRLRSDLDQCSGWELSKPHGQGTRQRPPQPALKCYLRGSRRSSSRPSECLTGGWCQNTSGPWDPATVTLHLSQQDSINHVSISGNASFRGRGAADMEGATDLEQACEALDAVCTCEIKMKQ